MNRARLGKTVISLLFLFSALAGCREISYFNDTVDTNSGGDVSDTDTDTFSGAGSDTGSDSESAHTEVCGALVDRLSITPVALDEPIFYVTQGYNNLPLYLGAAIARSSASGFSVGWTNADKTHVHITPLDNSLARTGGDVTLLARDLGDMLQTDNGLALLLRRKDPAADVAVDTDPASALAPHLVGVTNGVETFSTPLTGTQSASGLNDDNNVLLFKSRLAWNGTTLGAYFEIHGGVGHLHEGFFGDKLVYLKSDGTPLTGGWNWMCSTNQGLDLLAETGAFTALCLADNAPAKGLNRISNDGDSVSLSKEITWAGYNGGALGGLIKMEDGTSVAGWTTRGWNAVDANARTETHDIALLKLDANRIPTSDIAYLTDTPEVDEISQHMAPYGPDQILLLWEEVHQPVCSLGTCTGSAGGTFLRVVRWNGSKWQGDPAVPIPATMPFSHKLFVDENGDVLWAYTEQTPDYSAALKNESAAPRQTTLQIARLRYCAVE